MWRFVSRHKNIISFFLLLIEIALLTLLSIQLIYYDDFSKAPLFLLGMLSVLALILMCAISDLLGLSEAEKLYNKKCEPNIIIQYTQRMLPKLKKEFTKTIFRLDLAVGQFSGGDAQLAYTELIKLDLSNNMYTDAIRACYFSNFALVQLSLGDKAAALARLRIAEQFMNSAAITNKLKRVLDVNIKQIKASIFIAEGGFYRAEDVLNSIMDAKIKNVSKIGMAVLRGIISSHKGETDKAKEYFSYVAKEGNKLADTQKAVKCLAELEKGNNDTGLFVREFVCPAYAPIVENVPPDA